MFEIVFDIVEINLVGTGIGSGIFLQLVIEIGRGTPFWIDKGMCGNKILL